MLPDNLGVPDDVNIIKRGESCINLSFRRSMGGLTLTVRTLPGVEEFFRNLSTPDHVDARTIGRHWTALDKDLPLMVYNLAEPVPIINLDGYKRIRFDWVSRPLVSPCGDGISTPKGGGADINMAFLRLVGIGEGNGITFRLKGPFSDEAATAMRDDIALAGRKFYQTYMRPLNLNVAIVTQEWVWALACAGLGIMHFAMAIAA